jgi:dTDP-4-dehydrorhamnose reductase
MRSESSGELRWLVTGSAGMLGHDLVPALQAHGYEVTASTHAELDIDDETAIAEAVSGHDVVVNLAAWTNVDAAEDHEEQAHRVNADGAGRVASACAAVGARMVQLSTDYVFDGTSSAPYSEDAATRPLNAYGRTKRDGEINVRTLLPDTGTVVRTSWLYGACGPNFVATMARLASEREFVDVVNDQEGQPTWTADVAQQIIDLVVSGAPAGVYHATNAGTTTWWGLARAVFEELGLDPRRVRATDSSTFQRPARRPAYSVLGHARWAAVDLPAMRNWREALHAAAPSVLAQVRSDL